MNRSAKQRLTIVVLQLVTIAILLISNSAKAQDFEHSNSLTTIISPGSFDDGFSIGIQYEYKNRTVYVGPEIYMFPDLHGDPDSEGIDYYHLIGRIGLNHHIGGEYFHVIRLYSGVRIGGILRDNTGQWMLGLEAGFDFKIPDTPVFIRFSFTSDMKTDSKIWGNDPYHTVNSGILGIGINF